MTQRVVSILFFLSLITCQAYGVVDYAVELTSVSSSGRTITLDRGQFEHIARDDFAFLIEKKEIEQGRFIYRPIAKLKIIKLLDRESMWIAYKIYSPKAIVKGSKHFLLSETALLKGREQHEFSQVDLVTKENPDAETEDFLLEGDTLSKKTQDYTVIEKPHEKEAHHDNDGKLVNVHKWETKLGDDKYYISGIYKGPNAKAFAQRVRYRSFEKMVIAFLQKYNDPTFDRKKLYGENEGLNSDYVPPKSVFASARTKYEERLINQARKEEEFYQKMKAKGGRWSENYSDAELSEVLNKMSVIRERQRREDLIALQFSYQGFLGMSLNILNNENLNDTTTSQASRYDLEAGLEGYLFAEQRNFQRITTEFTIRSSRDGFYGGTLNVRSQDYSLAGYLNWYPFRRPSAIKKNVLYLGVGMRFGIASLTNDTFEETGNYQLSSFPAFRAGIKYHLESGYGIRLTAGYENLKVDRITKEFDNGSLPDRANYQEAKLGISLSKFF